MKKLLAIISICILALQNLSAQSFDFIPGSNVIFEDKFDADPVGDLPAKWSTSGDGEVVTLDRLAGKWFKITQPTAVSPELTEALPENCTIEFDLFLKNTSGIAPHIMFGLTKLSDVSASDVYRQHIWVVLRGYTENGNVEYGKTIQDLGSKTFAASGYVGRKLHVSIAINKTRLRVYLDKQKIVDLPKLLTDEYRNNFYIASSTVIPSPEEGVYFSNVRIAAGDVDARSQLIKQLMEQGSVVTNNISFNTQTNEVTPNSYPTLDTLGQALVADPSLNIQINGMEQIPAMSNDNGGNNNNGAGLLNEEQVKLKVDKLKAYIVDKFNVNVDRIVTGATNKIKQKMTDLKNGKTAAKIKGFLTEIVKL
jgi:OmpA-OmpF porin, OOP family